MSEWAYKLQCILYNPKFRLSLTSLEGDQRPPPSPPPMGDHEPLNWQVFDELSLLVEKDPVSDNYEVQLDEIVIGRLNIWLHNFRIKGHIGSRSFVSWDEISRWWSPASILSLTATARWMNLMFICWDDKISVLNQYANRKMFCGKARCIFNYFCWRKGENMTWRINRCNLTVVNLLTVNIYLCWIKLANWFLKVNSLWSPQSDVWLNLRLSRGYKFSIFDPKLI
jgi:hypothetical protein